MNIKEDLNTAGIAPVEVKDDDIETAKKNAIKVMLGEDDLNLDNLSDEELDQLLGRTQTMQEKINDIIESMDLLGSTDFDIQEALRVHTGMKLAEAAEVLKDSRLNG